MPVKLLKSVGEKWRHVTRHSRVLPDFLIIGAQRCGTSTLYEYLRRHPCVGGAARKEVGFFDEHFDRGLDWYRAQFPTGRQKQAVLDHHSVFLTGEASPSYLLNPNVPPRVAATLPTIRLIAILRNPVDRAYSNYHREVRQGREHRPFQEVVASQLAQPLHDWIRALQDPGADLGAWRFRQYLARGCYAVLLRRWLSFFSREQLLVLNGDDFFTRPAPALERLSGFLGLPPWSGAAFQEVAEHGVSQWLARKYDYHYPPMEESVRNQLTAFYRQHNHDFYELLGQDFGWDAG